MRRFFAVISLGIFIVLLFLFTSNKSIWNRVTKPETKYEKIMKIDLENNYPETIEEVMTVNNEIVKYLYGANEEKDEKKIDKQLNSLISKQMELWDEELLEINTLEETVSKTKKEIENYKSNNIFVIDYKATAPEEIAMLDESRKIKKVKVFFYTNVDQDMFIQYGIRKTGDKWKIMGWNNTK